MLIKLADLHSIVDKPWFTIKTLFSSWVIKGNWLIDPSLYSPSFILGYSNYTNIMLG